MDPKQKFLLFDDTGHLGKTLDSLNKLRKNKQFCDVVLQIGTSQDVREIHAHRAVLASASPYLFELFTSGNKAKHLCQYKLNGSFDLDAFEKLVEYAYTARLEIPKDKVRAVYIAANRLRMHSAAKQCGRFLMDNLNPNSVISLRSIPRLALDPEFLVKIDDFLYRNISEVARSKELLALPTVQIELLQNTSEERKTTNATRLCNMILDWMKQVTEDDSYSLNELTEKVHMLYLNLDHTLHDCNDIENGDIQDSEVIQDYKKLSRRVSLPNACRSNRKPTPAKPGNAESDSSSSLSDEDDRDWKVIATALTGEHSVMGLVVASGQLTVLSVVLRLHTPSHSPSGSRNTSVEKTSSFATIPPMSSPRCAVGTAESGGKLLVCGGYDRGECLRTVEMYDPRTNQWETLKSMTSPRGRFGITVVAGKVYAIGGCDGTKELKSAEVFDPETSQWNRLPNLPVVRSYAGVCSLDDRIYVIGGWNGQFGMTRCDVLDPQTNVWTNIAPLLAGCYQAGVVNMNGEIYAVGGCDSWNCLSSVQKYDPKTDSWSFVAQMHFARRGCGVAVYNEKLYAVGGHSGVHSLYTTEIYDPQTNTWTSGPVLKSSRANVGVTVVEDRLFAVGGFNGKTFLNTIEFLDAHTNEWTTVINSEIENAKS